MSIPPNPPHPADTSGSPEPEVPRHLQDHGTQYPVPVDLRALLTQPTPEQQFAVEPILPAGKAVGMTATRGDGKSLLALEIACAKATGRAVLGQPAGPPIRVMYIDMEMGPEDLQERFPDLGFGPDSETFELLEQHLTYFQLPDLPPLDTENGGHYLEVLLDLYKPDLVIIDTLSRIVAGRENETETYRDLFRNSERLLKRRSIPLLRLDHLGKDKERGSRGASAKEDTLDIVWQMSVDGDQVELKRTKGRQAGLPEKVVLNRVEVDGVTRHRMDPLVIHPDVKKVVDALDSIGVDPSEPISAAQTRLQQDGFRFSKKKISDAVRWRRNRPGNGPDSGSEPLSGTGTGNRPRTATEPPGTAGNRPSELLVPSIEGTDSSGPAQDGRNPHGFNPCEGCGNRTFGLICRTCKAGDA